jgi:hypothetical protein
VSTLSGLPRLVLWDYERGSLHYDLFCVLLLLIMLLVPPHWLGDPMLVRP